jgi:carboxypeptidase C (cathepsin A)
MPLETSPSFEQDRNNYTALRDAYADNSLSSDEVKSLNKLYEAECEELHDETNTLCKALQKEVNQYNEMTEMSREQMQKLQILTGIPKSQIDGLRGPTSFAQYQMFTDMIPELSDL